MIPILYKNAETKANDNTISAKCFWLTISVTIVFVFIFFAVAHPLMPWSGDDWHYISPSRLALPLWGIFEPSQVFPDTFLPLSSVFAIYLVQPIVDDFILSLAIAETAFAIIMVSIYFYFFNRFIVANFKLSRANFFFISIFFTISCFILPITNANTVHMFYSQDVTCYFNYIFAGIINAVIVLYLISNSKCCDSSLKKGLLALGIYLSIFSNAFHNIIIVMFFCWNLLLAFPYRNISQNYIKCFVKEHWGYLICIFIWLISLLYDACGQRAEQPHSILSITAIKITLGYFFEVFSDLNRVITITSLVVIISSYILAKKDITSAGIRYKRLLYMSIFCFMGSFVYLSVVFSAVWCTYVLRNDAMFAIYFYFLMATFCSLSYIAQRFTNITVIFPILAYIFITYFQELPRYNDSLGIRNANCNVNLSPAICLEVNRYMVNNILESYQSRPEELKIYVPNNLDKKCNWPHPLWMGEEMFNSLKEYGLIEKEYSPKIITVPDSSISKKFHLWPQEWELFYDKNYSSLKFDTTLRPNR